MELVPEPLSEHSYARLRAGLACRLRPGGVAFSEVSFGNRCPRSPADRRRILDALGKGRDVEITSARGVVVHRRRVAIRGDGGVDVTLPAMEPANAIRADWLRRTE